MTAPSPTDLLAVGPGAVVEFRLPPTLRTPFVARRLVSSLVSSGPRLRAIDAALLTGELATLMLPRGETILVSVSESGRSIRVVVGAETAPIDEPDAIVTTLLDRVADRWAVEAASVWFELDLIRRRDLSGLTDESLFSLLPDDRDARDELFSRFAPFASSLSRRFRTRDHRTDDLEQVALIGLVQALERFDPEVGAKFTTYAGQTITGVLKRHLRDHSWSIRVPRSLKEDALNLNRARAELTQRLGREPLFAELADTLTLTAEQLQEAMLAGATYSLASIDAPVGDDQSDDLASLLGSDDPGMAIAEDWPAVEAVLDRLTDREQQILYLRFFEDLTQAEIAEVVGVSQVHVSRMLKASLEKVRVLLDDQGGEALRSEGDGSLREAPGEH